MPAVTTRQLGRILLVGAFLMALVFFVPPLLLLAPLLLALWLGLSGMWLLLAPEGPPAADGASGAGDPGPTREP